MAMTGDPEREALEALSDEQMQKLVELLTDPAKADAALSQAERDEYDRCIQSVIKSRREGERTAHEHWVY